MLLQQACKSGISHRSSCGVGREGRVQDILTSVRGAELSGDVGTAEGAKGDDTSGQEKLAATGEVGETEE